MNLEFLYCKILRKLKGRALHNVKKGRQVKIYSGCHIVDTVIGDFTYCSYDSKINKANIGKFCSIASRVTIGAAEHPWDWTSTSPVFENVKNSGSCFKFAKEELPPLKVTNIGHDVWIGEGAMIKQGVTIGNGAVIGAMAMVTKDVPPYAIVVGVPAGIIRYRFDESIISALEESKWWDYSDDKLKEISKYIKTPRKFIEAINTIIDIKNE